MKKIDLINIAISFCLTVTIGFTAGFTIGAYQTKAASFPEIKTLADINPGKPTIELLEVKNNELIGRVNGSDARLAYSPEDILELSSGSTFHIPVAEIRLADFYQAERIPEDVSFIASSQGKYYYSLLDKRALGITPANRLYFNSAREAENEGFEKPS